MEEKSWPWVVTGVVAAILSAVGIGFACSKSNDSSGSGRTGGKSSGNDKGDNEPKSPLKPACLLAGYSGAGKSEFLCSLQDYVNNNGKRKTHSRGVTISAEQPTIMVSGIQITCIDGPGNLNGGQPARYRNFLNCAFNAGELSKFVVVFVVNLTTLLGKECQEEQRHVKSDLDLLKKCAIDALEVCGNRDSLKGQRIKFLCIGSHLDDVQTADDVQTPSQLQEDFVGWFNRNLTCEVFEPKYVAADLYNTCDAAEQFSKVMEQL